jgi:hypothetical protein
VKLKTLPYFHTFQLFTVNSMILQYTQQGASPAPMYPWCNPKDSVKSLFKGSAVMAEDLPDAFDIHAHVKSQYTQIVSRIQLA